MTRRFVCPPDAAWQAIQDLLRAAGLLAVALAALLQLTSPFWTLTLSAGGVLAAALWVTDRQVRLRAGAQGSAFLRWDGEQWWWQTGVKPGTRSGPERPLPTSRTAAGEPLADPHSSDAGSPAPAVAVTPHVLLDAEHWLLLRLVPVGGEGRFWRHHSLAVSRRQSGGHWSLLRIHLFMART